jgi:O-acetyl-ADP-ribose deacetylase (regulator of RNase III)
LNVRLIWGRTAVHLVKGDITDQDVDALVNAANSTLLGGGGVDGAVHRRGGPKLLEECKLIRQRDWPLGLPSGEAVITSGGNLKAKRVIHTVGPIWRGGNSGEASVLASCYRNSLKVAIKEGLRSVAFPSISTGAFGYPIKDAARIALQTVKEFVEREGRPESVVFVLFSEEDAGVYRDIISSM